MKIHEACRTDVFSRPGVDLHIWNAKYDKSLRHMLHLEPAKTQLHYKKAIPRPSQPSFFFVNPKFFRQGEEGPGKKLSQKCSEHLKCSQQCDEEKDATSANQPLSCTNCKKCEHTTEPGNIFKNFQLTTLITPPIRGKALPKVNAAGVKPPSLSLPNTCRESRHNTVIGGLYPN